MDPNACGYANAANAKAYVEQQYASVGAMKSAVTSISPIVRLANAIETAEQTAGMVHRVRIAMIGDVPETDASGNKEYHGEGLIGRIAEAAARIERISARVIRDIEDMHRAAGDF